MTKDINFTYIIEENGLTVQKGDKILLFDEVLKDLHWNLAYKSMIWYDIFEMLAILKRYQMLHQFYDS